MLAIPFRTMPYPYKKKQNKKQLDLSYLVVSNRKID